jgi:hypothetical protein
MTAAIFKKAAEMRRSWAPLQTKVTRHFPNGALTLRVSLLISALRQTEFFPAQKARIEFDL